VHLAAEIIAVLDRRGLAVREAAAVTGITAADLSRIRKARSPILDIVVNAAKTQRSRFSQVVVCHETH
jgi:hypothetical protein